MSFLLASVKITGTPGPSGWSQVHEFRPDDPEKLGKRGHLFAVVAAAPEVGRELILRLQEEYFGNLEATAFYALKNAVGKTINELGQSRQGIEVAAAAVLGEVVYSAAGGGGRVEVYREGNMAKILESSGVEAVSASGYPKPADQIVLGTNSFFNNVSSGIIKAALEGPDPQGAVESLGAAIHSNPDSGNMGCVVIKFTKTALLPSVSIAKPFFKRLFFSLVRALPERKIFVKKGNFDEEVSVGRKKTLWVGAILLGLLLVSIGFGIKQSRTRKFKESYRDILTAAKEQLIQAENILASDPSQSRGLFLDSKAKTGELISRKIKDKDLTILEEQIKEKESQIMGIYRVTPELYLDLSLLSSGFKGNKLIASGESLYVLDKAGKRLVGIVLATKKTNVLAGPDQLEGISDIIAYENKAYGVFADGIYLLGNKKEKVIAKDWRGEILAYAYAGNIYVLGKEEGVIWRHQSPPTGGGSFGIKQNWLAAETKPDFTGVKQIFIDGAVWVLNEPFKISKFSLGSPQAFSPKGVFPEIAAVAAVYSNEEDKYLYVLGSEQKRIIVLEKNGAYHAQYLADEIGQAAGLVVSEKNKKIILLTGDKLYSIEVKHI